MTIKKLLPWIFGGGLAYYLWKQYANATELASSAIISPNSLSLDTTYISAPKLVVGVNITNPSPNTVTINKIFGIVSFEGQQIGTINNNDTTKIAATSTSKLDLFVTLNSLQILTKLFSLDLSKPLDLTVDGYLVANNIQLPLNLDYSLQKVSALIPNSQIKVTSKNEMNVKSPSWMYCANAVLKINQPASASHPNTVINTINYIFKAVVLASNDISGPLSFLDLTLLDFQGNIIYHIVNDQRLQYAQVAYKPILNPNNSQNNGVFLKIGVQLPVKYYTYKKIVANIKITIGNTVYSSKYDIPVKIINE